MSERSLERWMHMLPCGARARKDYEALQAENKELRSRLALDELLEVQDEQCEENNASQEKNEAGAMCKAYRLSRLFPF